MSRLVQIPTTKIVFQEMAATPRNSKTIKVNQRLKLNNSQALFGREACEGYNQNRSKVFWLLEIMVATLDIKQEINLNT